jgi:hypothetical protein
VKKWRRKCEENMKKIKAVAAVNYGNFSESLRYPAGAG